MLWVPSTAIKAFTNDPDNNEVVILLGGVVWIHLWLHAVLNPLTETRAPLVTTSSP